jgi:restriction endonuclease S subunit
MKKQEVKLIEVAEVFSGYSFRAGLGEKAGKDIYVIQAKDVDEHLYIDTNELVTIEKRDFKEKFFLKEGDVILSARGKLKAAVLETEQDNIIASSSVYIIRPKRSDVTPEYLAVFLNSIDGQRRIREKVTGSAIKTILRKDLEDISIIIPNLKTQKEVVDGFKIGQREQELFQQKTLLKKQISEGLISHLINK